MLSWDEFDEEETTTAAPAAAAAQPAPQNTAKLDNQAAGSVEESRAVSANDSAAVARAKQALDDLDIQEGLAELEGESAGVFAGGDDRTRTLQAEGAGRLQIGKNCCARPLPLLPIPLRRCHSNTRRCRCERGNRAPGIIGVSKPAALGDNANGRDVAYPWDKRRQASGGVP